MSPVKTRRIVRHKAKGPVDPSLGIKVKHLRTARGLTQAALAAPDFTKAFISHVENGRTRVSLRAAEIIASRLGVVVTDLFADTRASEQQVELELLRAEAALADSAFDLAEKTAGIVARRASGLLKRRAQRVIGRVELATGRLREAARTLRAALPGPRSPERAERAERALRTRILFDLATAHAGLDDIGEAIGLALECQRELGAEIVDRTLELQTRALLAVLYDRAGDHSSADLQAEQAAELAQDVSEPMALARLYAALVDTRVHQGDLEGALVAARKSVDLHDGIGSEAAAAHAWNNLAWIYIQRRQPAKAEAAIAKAVAIAERHSLAPLRAHLDVTQAELEFARGRHRRALDLLDRVLGRKDLAAWTRGDAALLRARSLRAAGSSAAEVRRAFDAALRAVASEPRGVQARTHEAYAEYLADAGREREAYEHSHKALELNRPRLA